MMMKCKQHKWCTVQYSHCMDSSSRFSFLVQEDFTEYPSIIHMSSRLVVIGKKFWIYSHEQFYTVHDSFIPSRIHPIPSDLGS